jgi:DNA-binding NarL/FixJ family response regulator
MKPEVDVAPAGGTVAILEDESPVSSELEHEISALGYNVVGVADSLPDFEGVVKTSKPDAVSIDWRIGNYDQGPEALGFVTREHEDSGRVVYTKHRNRARDARKWGADEVVIKGDASVGLSEYLRSLTRVIKLGLLRGIVRCLVEVGAAAGLAASRALTSLDSEAEIFAISRRVVMEKRRSGKDSRDLRLLLERRGWWLTLDVRGFVKLPWEKKFEHVARPVGIDSNAVAVILGMREEVAGHLLHGELPPRGFDRDQMERVDSFLSVLAHVLRISQYEIEMMPYFWNVQGLYDGSLRPPPWNRDGLGEFLLEKGPAGLTDALTWIRR